jgi:hypothetical protein
MKHSTLSKRTAVFVAMLATAISLLACAIGGGSVSVIGTDTPVSSPTAVSTNTPHGTNSSVIVNLVGSAGLADGSIGLTRLTGQIHTWTQAVTVPATEQSATLVGLQLIIGTGNDDLRGTSDNAEVVIHFSNVGDQTYSNVNQSQLWNNWETHIVTLTPIPPATKVGNIQSITIVTAFTGGTGGDNWDIYSVKLIATMQS